MRPFFCRQGSKRKYSKALLSLFPQHTTYVEPFLGGGAVFWEKEPSPKEVVNDLDSKLVADYTLLKSAPPFGSVYKILTTESAQNEFLRKKHTGKADRIVESLLRRCNGYGGTYIETGTSQGVYTDDRKGRVHKVTTHEDKLKRIGEYRKRLSNATLTNKSYEDVLRTYDSPSTFFFMDPPYEKSAGLDYAEGSDTFPFAKFAEDVRRLKGKFLVTINDSRAIRKLFKGLRLYPYVVKGHHAKSAIGKEDRKELLITNYELPRQWKARMTKGVLKGGAYEAEDDEVEEGERLVGGMRGVADPADLYNAILPRVNALKPEKRVDWCAVYAFFVLSEYFNKLNVRRVLRAHKPGVGVDQDLLAAELLAAGLRFDTFDQPVGDGNFEGFDDDTLDFVKTQVSQQGIVAVCFSQNPTTNEGHISVIIPQRNPTGGPPPYLPHLFDCLTPRGVPVPMGPTWAPPAGWDYVRVLFVDDEPIQLGDKRNVLLRKLRELEAALEAAQNPAAVEALRPRLAPIVQRFDAEFNGFATFREMTPETVLQGLQADYLGFVRAWRTYLEDQMRGGGTGKTKPSWWRKLTGRGGGADFLPTLKRRFQLDDEQMEMLRSTDTHEDALVLARGLGTEVDVPPETLRQMERVFWGPGSCAVFALHVLEVAMGHTMGVADAALLSLQEGGLGDEQTREFLREAGHTLKVVREKPLDALRDALDAGQMGIVHFLDEGEGHATAFVPEPDGDYVLVDCDEGVLPFTLKTLEKLGTVDAVTVVTDMRGGISRQNYETYTDIGSVQATEWKTLYSATQNIRRVVTFLSKPGIFTEADLKVLGPQLKAVTHELKKAEAVVKALGKEEPLRRKRDELLVKLYIELVARMDKLEVEDDAPPTPKGQGVTHKTRVLRKLGLPQNGYSLDELANASGVPKATLQEVYNRGIGAYKTNPESVRMKGSYEKGVEAPMRQKLSKEQWAQARVYSFLDENPKHDTDLRGKGSLRQQLRGMDYAPEDYLRDVRKKAKDAGYDPKAVSLATNGEHKVEIHTPDGRTVRFGRVGYGDHLMWSHKEGRGDVPKGTADRKRKVFRISHSAIRGKWRSDRFSPNNLALALLW